MPASKLSDAYRAAIALLPAIAIGAELGDAALRALRVFSRDLVCVGDFVFAKIY